MPSFVFEAQGVSTRLQLQGVVFDAVCVRVVVCLYRGHVRENVE